MSATITITAIAVYTYNKPKQTKPNKAIGFSKAPSGGFSLLANFLLELTIMKNFIKFSNFYILKISRGEKINEEIAKFCKRKARNGGFFMGIGAVGNVILAHYSVANKKYSEKKIQKPLELVNLTGNVCFSGEDIIVHSHATLSDNDLKTIAGHLVEAKVSGACEVIFFPFSRKIKKLYDKITGLKLMKF